MHWSDQAVILSVKKHGETSALVRVLAREHGVFGGVVRGGSSKANKGIYQPGNRVDCVWNARLSEQLGSLKAELRSAVAAYIMNDAGKLAALASACALIESALPERHPYPKLFDACASFLQILPENPTWQQGYIRLELSILAESGFGLDLSHCAATGATEDLIYVSPKSGRAVSREAGEPYKEKLLKLPAFFNNPKEGGNIADGLALTGYFLEHWLLSPHHRKLPAARQRLLQTLYKPA